ncbi:MAG: glycine cleavage system protein GcvH [Candidatus Nephthysia bennettiae]|uniref:Glycine cleavage system H protein n=1 Tax=Candidatus Nephthysia bennettiae TaxID=3127016 RepID=A0A934K6K4_9BACT|nr:glycine cleavage system protein GcvH [Candidatus Dormibacteraeota bacterium]MBJ7612355.1 glycine cleavage system protein GcvH [Candidatus Dormibacteraeota bacterium]PZR92337.1 MAG: glycine cleavage system protein GcvH [Candidatus Dormibacteraeota bacterium]
MADRYYTETHEWVQADGDVATIGITDFAQSQLGDVVFLELPSVGRMLEAGDSFGVVESVKAASDLYSPVAGAVVEVNEALSDAPETVNREPFEGGWLIKVRLNGDLGEGLLDEAGYKAVTEGQAH